MTYNDDPEHAHEPYDGHRFASPDDEGGDGGMDAWLRRAGFGDGRPRRSAAEEKRRKADVEKFIESVQTDNMLDVRPAAEWMHLNRKVPPLDKLFGEMWGEYELSILFGDAGSGKSMLGVQIADSIVRGIAIEPLAMTARPQSVLYLDFEMTDQQFKERYSRKEPDRRTYAGRYAFPKGLLRGQIEWESDVPKRYGSATDFILSSIDEWLIKHHTRVLIIDNISWLGATEAASTAAKLMKGLKYMKQIGGLSILVIAHTNKRDLTRSLNLNDLAGSKMLANYADNVFAIGSDTGDGDIRYVKQLKHRNGPIRFGESNMIVYRLEKTDTFPKFRFQRFDSEGSFLITHDDLQARKKPMLPRRADLVEEARRLSGLGRTQRSMALELGVSRATVNRYLREASGDGEEGRAAADGETN